MGAILLGIGELAASRHAGDVFQAVALGSCVAVVVHDPVAGVTGMAHVALPSCSSERRRRSARGYYADTAVLELLGAVTREGGGRLGGALTVKLVGGASILGDLSAMGIGKRNVLGVRRSLEELGLSADVEEVGGSISRTVRVRVSDARVTVSTPGQEDRAL